MEKIVNFNSSHHTKSALCGCSNAAKCLFVPSGLRSGNNVRGNICDLFVIKTSSERGHGVLSVGDLGDDSLFVSSSSEVLLKGLLLKSLLGHDDVLSSGVASSAVGVEDLLSLSNISGKSGLDGNSERDGTDGGGLMSRKKERKVRFKEQRKAVT